MVDGVLPDLAGTEPVLEEASVLSVGPLPPLLELTTSPVHISLEPEVSSLPQPLPSLHPLLLDSTLMEMEDLISSSAVLTEIEMEFPMLSKEDQPSLMLPEHNLLLDLHGPPLPPDLLEDIGLKVILDTLVDTLEDSLEDTEVAGLVPLLGLMVLPLPDGLEVIHTLMEDSPLAVSEDGDTQDIVPVLMVLDSADGPMDSGDLSSEVQFPLKSLRLIE